jgi:DNA repair photolyase
MNKSKGNMYSWIDFTWNPVKGKCPHKCNYCYMKRFNLSDLKIVEHTLSENLGKDKTVFVGSSVDLFASAVPSEWIKRVLKQCKNFDNVFLFQSKNPNRFFNFLSYFPEKTILGTTIETNKQELCNSLAPSVKERYLAMEKLVDFSLMVSVEPIMDFDVNVLTEWLADIEPEFVSIGADTRGHDLIEPSWEKIEELVRQLKLLGIETRLKENLKRLRD